MLQDVLGKKILKPPRCRQVVEYLRGGYYISERRACVVMQLNRGTFRYQSQKDPHTELRMTMREMAAARVRWVSKDPGPATAGRLVGRQVIGATNLSGRGADATGDGAEEKASGSRTQRSNQAVDSQPSLESGFCRGPTGRRSTRFFRALTVVDVYTPRKFGDRTRRRVCEGKKWCGFCRGFSKSEECRSGCSATAASLQVRL